MWFGILGRSVEIVSDTGAQRMTRQRRERFFQRAASIKSVL
jgi:hypothetical protein